MIFSGLREYGGGRWIGDWLPLERWIRRRVKTTLTRDLRMGIFSHSHLSSLLITFEKGIFL
jgi:hypothetical protein